MDFYKYTEMLDNLGVTSDVLTQIVQEHQTSLGATAYNRYGRYRQSENALPVFYDRTFEGEAQNKVNNHIPNDYFSEIVDTKSGYMFGLGVAVDYADENNAVKDALNNFGIESNIDDINSEVCTMAATTGYDTMLIYLDKEGKERLIRLDPWESIVLSKTNMTEPEYGINYYQNWKDEYIVDVYTPLGKRVFVGADGFSNLVERTEDFVPNPFSVCQLVGVPNNSRLQGDADKVLNLIDAYDNALSNGFDELDQFRLAYLLFIGYEPTDKMISDMVKTGALYIPDAGDGQNISWLTKDLDPTFMKEMLDRTEANITRFASHVNFTDAAFGGDITGPAMRYKLFALETKSKTFERKHSAALRHVYKALANSLARKGLSFDYRKVQFSYSRNIPANLLDEAQTAIAVNSIASLETALKAMPSIVGNDINAELERIEQEKEMYGGIDLDNVPGKTNTTVVEEVE